MLTSRRCAQAHANGSKHPVLKHGPRSLTYVRVSGWEKPAVRNESEGSHLGYWGGKPVDRGGLHHRPIWIFFCFERFEWEHICWDPKEVELCLHRLKPEETLVEGRSDTDVLQLYIASHITLLVIWSINNCHPKKKTYNINTFYSKLERLSVRLHGSSCCRQVTLRKALDGTTAGMLSMVARPPITIFKSRWKWLHQTSQQLNVVLLASWRIGRGQVAPVKWHVSVYIFFRTGLASVNCRLTTALI